MNTAVETPTAEAKPASAQAASTQTQPSMVAQVFDVITKLAPLGVLGEPGQKALGFIAIAQAINPLVVQNTHMTIEDHIQEKIDKFGRPRVASAIDAVKKAMAEQIGGPNDGGIKVDSSELTRGTKEFFKTLSGRVGEVFESFESIKEVKQAMNMAKAVSGISGLSGMIGRAVDVGNTTNFTNTLATKTEPVKGAPVQNGHGGRS